MDIFKLEEIKKSINSKKLFSEIEKGFIAFSEGKVVVPPIGHMHFDHPPGDLHIKYGHISSGRYFVVKLASHFPTNPEKGKEAITGLMLLFSQETGEPVALLEDEGYLSQVRTAIAGSIAAKHLAPKNVDAIGIIGTGAQACMQLQYLADLFPGKLVYIWGRRKEAVSDMIADPQLKGFELKSADSPQEIGEKCQLIITATSSEKPILEKGWIQKGTHITAVGADRPGKQELDPALLSRADLLVADSKEQSLSHGEFSHLKDAQKEVVELGEFISQGQKREDDAISVADLTGVAVQDIVIASHCYESLKLS